MSFFAVNGIPKPYASFSRVLEVHEQSQNCTSKKECKSCAVQRTRRAQHVHSKKIKQKPSFVFFVKRRFILNFGWHVVSGRHEQAYLNNVYKITRAWTQQ